MNKAIYDKASKYYNRQIDLIQKNEWGYDRFLKYSSGSGGVVVADLEEKDCSIWSINHYLGLNRHPYVIAKAKESLDIYGTGCGTSAMSGGHSQLHKNLIKRIAAKLNKEEVVLYSTGFTANSGAIASICSLPNTLILIDRDCHISITDGCKASGAKLLPFKHNSTEDLERKLERYSGNYENVLVVAESIYSMSGDIAPLQKIVQLKKKYNFLFFVDEAHTFGIYGDAGAGLCNELGIQDDVDFISTTLSKATASIGGVIATTKEFAAMLKWSSTHGFQASIPPADVATIDACLDLIDNEVSIVKSLMEKSEYCRKQMLALGLDLGHSLVGPILPVYIRDYDLLREIEKELFDNNIFTVAVIPPAVKSSKVRFRFIINNSHTKEQIDHLIRVLEGVVNRHPSIVKNI